MRGRRAWIAILAVLALNGLMSCAMGTKSPYNTRYAKAGWTAIEGATFVGEDTCASCHDEQAKRFQHTIHGQSAVKREGTETAITCENCHGPGSKHVDGEGDPRFILKHDSNNCMQCHREKKSEFSLLYHHPVPEGRMQCSDCHDPHKTGGASKTALRENDMCIGCHQEKRGPWTFEHEAMRDGCTTCHRPHGSVNNKLLTEPDGNLCMKCHFEPTLYQAIGHYGHRRALNPAPNNCVKCHPGIHGSNFSKEFRTE